MMSKKNDSNETFDERSDADFLPFDETANRSRMAWEAKIGLSVIFILLIVLGFVVYDRMIRSDDAPEAVAGAESSEADKEGTPTPEPPRSQSTPVDWTRQTVMDAKPGLGAAKTAPPRKRDSWGITVEDRQPSTPEADSTAATSPQSFMPRLVAPTPSDRYPDYRNSQTVGQTADSRQSGVPGVGESADSRPSYDRYPKAPTQTAAEDAEPGVASVADTEADGGSQLPSMEIAPSPQPELQQTPPRTQVTAAPRLAENTATARYPDRSLPVDRVAQSTGENTGQVQISTDWTRPRSPYRTLPELTPSTSQGSTAAEMAEPSSTAQMVPVQIAPAEITPTRAPVDPVAPIEIAPARTAVVEAGPSDPTSSLSKLNPEFANTTLPRKAAERRTALGSTQRAVGSGRVYVVQEGDNLFDIARYELGKPTRWTEIVNLNHELLGSDLDQLNYLTPGMRLVLPDPPAKQAPSFARQPGSLYER